MTDKYYFWNGIFSNFYQSTFIIGGTEYICNEQYFMKMKQELFDGENHELSKLIMDETNPKQIKKYGRAVKNYREDVWNIHKYNIMVTGLTAKFTQNKYLLKQLLKTKDKYMVEASPYDRIWAK